MLRARFILIIIVILSLAIAAPLAQGKEKVKKLAPTVRGSTGLFNVFLPDTLRQGEYSFGFNAFKFHRDPGNLDFFNFPVTFTVGLTDRVELFATWEAYKRVNADDIRVNRVAPGGTVVPSVLNNGQTGFFNEAPFMDVGFGDGTGDFRVGGKINIFSERRGDIVGLALQPMLKFRLTEDREHLLRGLTSGTVDGGFVVAFSRNFEDKATFAAHGGPMFARDFLGADRQHWIDWGIGLEVPIGSYPVHFITELISQKFLGNSPPNVTANTKSPVEYTAGVRIYNQDWLSVSGGYSLHVNRISEDNQLGFETSGRNGYFVQLALHRKVNRPPTISCNPTTATVTEGDTLDINAVITDSDDDLLDISWTTTGGTISDSGNGATLNTRGVTPGTYTVRGEVSDGDNTAHCTVAVTVEKNRMPPTVSCEPASASVTEGGSVTLQARASDPNNDRLTYAWAVDGSSVTNNRPSFEFGTAGRSVGRHTIRVTVTDVDNMSADCDFAVTIDRRPNRNPSVTLTLDKSEAYAGETVTATARGTDPDNDPLTYSWRVDGQTRRETGSSVAVNTSGMAGGSHSVTVTVTDDRNGSGSDTKAFSLTEKIIIPTNQIRPDNKAKAQLDEIALKLQRNAQLRVRITGHTDSRGSEAANERVGQRRADAAKDYLVGEHNIDAGRIETASAGEGSPIADNETAEGRKQNRRIEIELYVP